MNPAKRKPLIAGKVRSWFPRLFSCGLLAFSLAGWSADEPRAVSDLAVHEWERSPRLPARMVERSNGCRWACRDSRRLRICLNSWSTHLNYSRDGLPAIQK
jgi:hypothetical protein